MRKFIIFATTLALISSAQSPISSAFAASSSSETTVTIETDSKGGKTAKLKHVGLSASFTLTEGDSLKPFSFGNDEWLALATKVSTNKKKSIAVLASESTLSVAWELPEKSRASQLRIDGESVSTEVGAGSALISLPASRVRHHITATQQWLVNPRAKEGDSDFALMHYETISIDAMQPASTALTSTVSAIQSLSASLPTKTIVRYQTFITDNFVAVPIAGCPLAPAIPANAGYFQGNGRSFNPLSNDVKTQEIVTINWTGSSGTVYKKVGATNLWYFNLISGFWYLGSMQEPASSLYFDSLTPIIGGQTVFRIAANAANPYCPGVQPIYYDFTGSVSRSGGYDFSGMFRRVPNHEFYITDDVTNSWSTIMQSDIDALGFACLVPLMDCVSKNLHLVRP